MHYLLFGVVVVDWLYQLASGSDKADWAVYVVRAAYYVP